jgi:hypothetical protein
MSAPADGAIDHNLAGLRIQTGKDFFKQDRAVLTRRCTSAAALHEGVIVDLSFWGSPANRRQGRTSYPQVLTPRCWSIIRRGPILVRALFPVQHLSVPDETRPGLSRLPEFGGTVAFLSKNGFLIGVSTVPTTVPPGILAPETTVGGTRWRFPPALTFGGRSGCVCRRAMQRIGPGAG